MIAPLRTSDPTHLGDYQLVGRLGMGGMGTVYLGRGRNGRRVAVKTIRTEYAWDSTLRDRFRSEVNRLRQVPSFCTAAVLDADSDHDPPYLVVDYVSGPSLAAEVRQHGPLSPESLPGVIIGLTAALVAIHQAGVVHRDLKPDNVLITLGNIKIIDFGVARSLDHTSQHTASGQMIGTVQYMAPESFDTTAGGPVTAAADIFAWGVLVTYAATGHTPFTADTPPATAVRIATEPPDLTGLTGVLRDLVARSLAKRPEDRPTARELLEALLGIAPAPVAVQRLTPLPSSSPRPAPQPSRLRPMPSSPTPIPPTGEKRSYTVAFVILMVLTGLLGVILSSTVFYLLDERLSRSGPTSSPTAPADPSRSP